MKTPSIHLGKGRASAARPLLCVGLALFLLAALAPAAAADLPTPAVTATDPISPGTSLTPKIKGRGDGSDTKVVTFGVGTSGLGPITQELELDDTVRLYTLPNCAGSIVGEGTVELFEGEGISLFSPLAPDSVTTFYADVFNGSETSECSPQGLTYRQVTTAPATPSFTATNPPSPANQNFPRLIGSAAPDTTFLI